MPRKAWRHSKRCCQRARGYAGRAKNCYVLEAHRPHGLQSLAERHLGRHGSSYEDVCGKGAQQISFAQVELTRAAEYSGEDSDMTLHVHRTLWPRLEAEPKLRKVYEQIEMPASAALLAISSW